MAGICFGGGRVGLRRICFDMEYVRERVKIRGWGGGQTRVVDFDLSGAGAGYENRMWGNKY